MFEIRGTQHIAACVFEKVPLVDRHIQIILIGLFLSQGLGAQTPEEKNLVPNPGFEILTAIPEKWFYSGKMFTDVVQYWESPTGASPDAYGPDIYVPKHWREKGFGLSKAHKGGHMAGITVYGCHGGKPHCREYLQVELYEPLVPGQRYSLKYWIRHLPRSLQIDQLNAAFSDERVTRTTDEMLSLAPVTRNPDILFNLSGDWIPCSYEFIAASDAGFLIIGNFNSDEETRVRIKCTGECLPFAYYYIDDVELVKIPPILPIPVKADDLSRAELREGRTIRLNYVFFASGKAEFQPPSFRELNALARILQEHPGMEIELRGHTDNLGSKEFNEVLSFLRAKNVYDYLIAQGIPAQRLTYRGYASTEPIADNASDPGRQKNRRVEFYITRMSREE